MNGKSGAGKSAVVTKRSPAESAIRKSAAIKKEKWATVEGLAAEYNGIRPIADAFLVEIKRQLDHLLVEERVALSFPCEARVKDLASITAKIERVGLRLGNIRELQDLIGLRLVIQFRRDVATVTNIIEKNFKVARKYNTADRLNDDQFGYSSLHFIVEIKPEWLNVPTLSRFTGLKVELQVRTTAQHIWASASHTLQYKHEDSVPPSVKRAIFRVSALLETVDLEFERVLEERDLYRDNVPIENDNILNVDLLEKVLDSLWPEVNKRPGYERYEELLQDLQMFDITTVDMLREIIGKNFDEVMKEDADEVHRRANDEDMISERLILGVFFTHAGLTRNAMQFQFGDKWSSYMIDKTKKSIAL